MISAESRSWRASVACTLATVVAAVVAQVASHLGSFHPSLLLNVAETDPIAGHIQELDPSFQFTVASDHYDGVYFWAMARDPFATGQAHDLIDLAAYRYGHPLYGWLAGLLSAGQAPLLPWVFWLLSLASIGAAAIVVSRLSVRLAASPWLGLIVACSPGLLFSATTALTEPAQVAVVGTLLLVWLDKRPRPVLIAALTVAMCLLKEHLILVDLALGLCLLAQMVRERRLLWRRLLALLSGPAALGLWLLIVRSRFVASQRTYEEGNIGLPFEGWWETFRLASGLRVSDFASSQIGSTATPALIATATVLITATWLGLRHPSPLGLVVALNTALIACLSWRTLLYPHEMFRIPSVALVFAVLLLSVKATADRPQTNPIPK